MERFVQNRGRLSSWGPKDMDKIVDMYMKGLADWMVGFLHWSFESES